MRIFNVPSSRQFCKDKYCEGFLELIPKEKKETTREAPECDKFCELCLASYYRVPCAKKKCKCGHPLTKGTFMSRTGKLVNVDGTDLFIDPID